MLRTLALLAVSSIAILNGCSSDESSSGSSASSCKAATTLLCDKACACSTDGKCRITSPSETGGATITSDSKADCLALYSNFGCSQSANANADWSSCSAALGSAACVDVTDGKALVSPKECEGK